MKENCIFCKIIKKEASSEIIYEDENTIVFKSIRPVAPVHLLVVPKKHIESADTILKEDKDLIGSLFLVAQKAADIAEIRNLGYKLAINVGRGGGQEVFHIHIHLLGGWRNEKERDIPTMP